MSIVAAKWLADSDAALLMQAQMLADMIDQASAAGDYRTLLRAHPMLSKALAELGLAPRTRIQLELRSRKLGAAVVEGGELPANVTKIPASPRPPKRQR